MKEKLKVGDIYIDDTQTDFSDALIFDSDDEYELWLLERKRQIEKEKRD